MKLADTPDLGSGGASHGGSSPSARTIISKFIGSHISMQITPLIEDGLKKSYKIVVSGSDIQKDISAELIKLGSKVKLPGFRPGKVPAAIVKQKYGAEVIHDVLEKTISKAVGELVRQNIKEQDLKLATTPTVRDMDYDEGKDCAITVDLELLPKIEAADFKNIHLDKVVMDVSDAEVEEVVKELHEQYRHFVPLSEGRPAKDGDFVKIEISGKVLVNGKPASEFSSMLTAVPGEENTVFSGALEKQLIGLSVGDKLTIDDVISNDHEKKAWHGAPVHFDAKVVEIKERAHLDLDDSFAKALKFETLEELRKGYAEELKKRADNVSFMLLKRKLLDRLAELHTFDVPPTLLDTEFNEIWGRLQKELESEEIAREDDDTRTEEELKDEYRKISERRVRLGLLFSELAEKHNIKLTDDEIRSEVYKLIYSNPTKAKEIIEHFRKNKGAVDALVAPVMENKVVDYILTQIELKEVKVDRKTFEKETALLFPEQDEE